MKKVIIFDLDGTLLDTLRDLQKAVNYALAHFDYPLRSLEQVRKDIGNGVAKLMERSTPNGLENPNYAEALEIFKEYYGKNYNVYTHAYDGMLDVVKALRKDGFIVTVATNKIVDVAKELLDIHYPGQFGFIQGDAKGVHKKPHPDMIRNIIRHYRVALEDILYIGDTNVDEETALNASADYALVTYGYRTIEEIKNSCVCTNLINTPEELLAYIRRTI